MKILHIIPNLKKGGAERLVLDICNELQKREDVEVKLITFSADNEYPFLTKEIDWEVIPSSIKLSILKKNKFKITELQKAIEIFSPDIIHTHLYEAEIISRSCYYPLAIWFSHCHSKMPVFFKNDNTLKQKLIKSYEKRFLFKQYKKNGGTNFIAISKDTFNFYKKNVKTYNVSLLANGIDYKRFVNNDLYIDSDQMRLVSVGSLRSVKNHIFLIQVAKLLQQKKVNFILNIIGDGELKNQLLSLIEVNNLKDKVFLIGAVDHVEKYLWKSDIYVHSSKSEALGLTQIEAMAAGLPVVTLDGGGNKDLIIEGYNGFLIKDEDPNIFLTTLINLWNNKKEYLKQKKNAIVFAKEYDIINYCDELFIIYKKQLIEY